MWIGLKIRHHMVEPIAWLRPLEKTWTTNNKVPLKLNCFSQIYFKAYKHSLRARLTYHTGARFPIHAQYKVSILGIYLDHVNKHINIILFTSVHVIGTSSQGMNNHPKVLKRYSYCLYVIESQLIKLTSQILHTVLVCKLRNDSHNLAFH